MATTEKLFTEPGRGTTMTYAEAFEHVGITKPLLDEILTSLGTLPRHEVIGVDLVEAGVASEFDDPSKAEKFVLSNGLQIFVYVPDRDYIAKFTTEIDTVDQIVRNGLTALVVFRAQSYTLIPLQRHQLSSTVH